MKTAVATRFRCRRPLTDLTQLTLMFLTLILQYFNKLVEGEIGDFPSPQAFHPRKVQGFNGNGVEPLTKFRGELPMKVFTLVANPSIEACDFSHTPPPTVRTFLFTGQFFVETPKFLQVRFQRLGVLFLLTRAQCQICVFHTEVCPNALTCCRQRFCFYKVCNYVKPIITTSVTFYCDTTDVSIELTVLVERIRNFIISPLPSIPFTTGNRHTIVIQRPTRLFEGEGFKLMPFFDLRSTAKFLEKSVIRQVNASQFLLDRLTRQSVPMRVGRPFQIRHVDAHSRIVRIRQTVFISLALPLMEILVDLPHIVKQVAKSYGIRLTTELIFIRFHGISVIRLYRLSSGRQARSRETTLDMLANGCSNYTTFFSQCQIFLNASTGVTFSDPQLKQ